MSSRANSGAVPVIADANPKSTIDYIQSKTVAAFLFLKIVSIP